MLLILYCFRAPLSSLLLINQAPWRALLYSALEESALDVFLCDAGAPLTSTFLLALRNDMSSGPPVQNTFVVGFLASHNIFTPACPLS